MAGIRKTGNIAGIIDRYLLKEAAGSMLAVTGVLLLILLSNKFARFLGEAATGRLPGDAVFGLLALSSVQYLIVLMPVGMFLGLVLALGRLYRDNEMYALVSCGIGPRQLYRPIFLLASLLAMILAWLTLYAGPWSAQAALTMRRNAEQDAQLGAFEAGRFKGATSRDGVFYTENISEDGAELYGIFMQTQNGDKVTVVTATSGRQQFLETTGKRLLILRDGYRYDGEPGDQQFQETRYRVHGIDVYPDEPSYTTGKAETIPSLHLIGSMDPRERAELQWRISAPMSLLVLALIALPLSRSSPREGRYGRILMAILAYIVYSNLLAVARVWIERGQLPPLFGMWMIHLLVVGATLAMLGRQNGFFERWFKPTVAA